MNFGKNCVCLILSSRRQFGPKAKEEVKIIEHQTQTLRLMPHLATALALTFASRWDGSQALLSKDECEILPDISKEWGERQAGALSSDWEQDRACG